MAVLFMAYLYTKLKVSVFVRFVVLTVVLMKIQVFCQATPGWLIITNVSVALHFTSVNYSPVYKTSQMTWNSEFINSSAVLWCHKHNMFSVKSVQVNENILLTWPLLACVTIPLIHNTAATTGPLFTSHAHKRPGHRPKTWPELCNYVLTNSMEHSHSWEANKWAQLEYILMTCKYTSIIPVQSAEWQDTKEEG